jgi:hypothetical protein
MVFIHNHRVSGLFRPSDVPNTGRKKKEFFDYQTIDPESQ